MEPEVLEQEEQSYRIDPRRAFGNRMKRKGEQVFEEAFGTEIDFDEVEEEFSNIDAMEEIASTKVNEPNFPIITFLIALFLDLLDLVQLTGVLWFVMAIVNIIFTIILFILMYGKLNSMFTRSSKFLFRGRGLTGLRSRKRGGKSRAQVGLNKIVKKYIGRYMSRRLAAILIVNLIPILGILASNAFFVFLAHNKQKKMAQKYIVLVEKVGKILMDFERRLR
jgi:hypothetical protein